MSIVCVSHQGKLFILDKQYNEVDEDGYIRLWYIIKNNLDIDNPADVSKSIKYLNERVYGMGYTPAQC